MGGCAWSRTAPGPLEAHAIAFARWLADAGFSQSRIERRLCQLGHLSGWLEIEGLRPDELTVEHQQRFIEARRMAGHRTWLSPHSLRVPQPRVTDRVARVLKAAGIAELGKDRDRRQLTDAVDLIDQRPAPGLLAGILAQRAIERAELQVDRVDHPERDRELLARRARESQGGDPLAVGEREQLASVRAAAVEEHRLHPTLLPLRALM